MPRDYWNPESCVAVGPAPDGTGLCTIEGTLYGYEPNIGANAFFAAFFGICLLIQLVLGIKYKTWTYMVRPLDASTAGEQTLIQLLDRPWFRLPGGVGWLHWSNHAPQQPLR